MQKYKIRQTLNWIVGSWESVLGYLRRYGYLVDDLDPTKIARIETKCSLKYFPTSGYGERGRP
jgi:hypothetical protein